MATIRAPSGNEEACVLKRLPNRHIGWLQTVWKKKSEPTPVSETVPPPPAGISFTPKEVGEHVVSVKKNGKHVTNSPFRIMVGQSEIGDASKVKVFGQGLVEGHTFEVAEFIVDTRNAGDSHIHSASEIQTLGFMTLILTPEKVTHTSILRDRVDPHP